EDVRKQERPEVADMGRAIDRRAAAVDADVARLQRLEWPDLARERVAEVQGHGRTPSRWIVATAVASITRPAPASPARLPDDACTLTAASSMPRSSAIVARMAGRCNARRGRPARIVTSTARGRQPAALRRATASRTKPALAEPRGVRSSAGWSAPRS